MDLLCLGRLGHCGQYWNSPTISEDSFLNFSWIINIFQISKKNIGAFVLKSCIKYFIEYFLIFLFLLQHTHSIVCANKLLDNLGCIHRYSTTDHWIYTRIYKMNYQFWAVLGSRGCREKKSKLPWVCNFRGHFFMFSLSKNFF